MNLLTAAMA